MRFTNANSYSDGYSYADSDGTYSNSELAGKDATIRVTVRGVKEKILPALDDALAKNLTNGKQETAEAYRWAVREELEESSSTPEDLAATM